MKAEVTRRDCLTLAAGIAAALAAEPTVSVAQDGGRSPAEPFGYCLNTSTLMGQKLSIEQEVDIAGKAGYHGLEPWIRELDAHVKAGKSLKDLGKQIADHGLTVESAIGFFEWAVDDEGQRKKGLEEAKRNMEMVRAIGGKRLAAPPAGATDRSDIGILRLAERYRTLLELGDTYGVVPEAEVWGFSKTLGRLGEGAAVAIESGHPRACILPDVFHLYKGGSGLGGIRLLGPASMFVFHFNDYPASPPRSEITDAQRVYPGDGVAPLKELVRSLRDIGFRGMLSLELFNREYWTHDALEVARTGLEKMRAVVKSGLA